MATASGLRIGNADREAVASSLREHYAHGRLSLDEFQQRLDATFAARTDLDLSRITSDLPHTPAFAGPWPVATRPAKSRQSSGPGLGSRRSMIGAFANLVWLLAFVLVVASLFGLFGAFIPKPLLILLAIFTFSRRIVRRFIGGGRLRGPRGRGRPF